MGPDPAIKPPAPEAPSATAPACRHCGSAMVAGQDWCLECGTAAPGRLSQRGGWRMASSVTGLTVLIASGIVAASYAALSSDSKRAVSRPAPVVAAAPVTTTPVVPVTPVKPVNPPVTPPPVAPKTIKPGLTPKVTPAPVATPTPAVTPTTTTPKATPKPTGPQPILLDTDAASTYDPANHPQGTFGDPSNAIDQDPATAWTATLDANDKLGAGINIDLKSPHKVGFLRITTDTPGMAVRSTGRSARFRRRSPIPPGRIWPPSRPSSTARPSR